MMGNNTVTSNIGYSTHMHLYQFSVFLFVRNYLQLQENEVPTHLEQHKPLSLHEALPAI